MSSLVSRLTLGAVGLTCKTFLKSGYCASVTVNGFENIEKALRDRRGKNGVITVSNHVSTLDDPVTWGVVPWPWYFSRGMIRWSLGAADIIFTNPVFSAFFRKGQVLETFRGQGIYQPAVDTAIEKLNQGEWIHLFGEGKVHQPGRYPPLPASTESHSNGAHIPDQNQAIYSRTSDGELPLLLRFKWGVGRILMESKEPPTIIPMWLTGFQDLMPEGRSFPWKYLPRRNVPLSVTFGEPISPEALLSALDLTSTNVLDGRMMRIDTSSLNPPENGAKTSVDSDELNIYNAEQEAQSRSLAEQNWLGSVLKSKTMAIREDTESRTTARIRSELTAVIQREVEKLGRRVLAQKLQ